MSNHTISTFAHCMPWVTPAQHRRDPGHTLHLHDLSWGKKLFPLYEDLHLIGPLKLNEDTCHLNINMHISSKGRSSIPDIFLTTFKAYPYSYQMDPHNLQ